MQGTVPCKRRPRCPLSNVLNGDTSSRPLPNVLNRDTGSKPDLESPHIVLFFRVSHTIQFFLKEASKISRAMSWAYVTNECPKMKSSTVPNSDGRKSIEIQNRVHTFPAVMVVEA